MVSAKRERSFSSAANRRAQRCRDTHPQVKTLRTPRRRRDGRTAPPFPPFTRETAIEKVRLAEDGWNSRNPEKIALAYTVDSRWRNRAEFANGRDEIIAFLTRKWQRELDYRLIKELWSFDGNHIAVRFAYEFHDDSGNWFRSYGNENWEFDDNGLMQPALCLHQ